MKNYFLIFVMTLSVIYLSAQSNDASISFTNIECMDDGTRVTSLSFDHTIVVEGEDLGAFIPDDGLYFFTEASRSLMPRAQPAFGIENFTGTKSIFVNPNVKAVCSELIGDQIESLFVEEGGFAYNGSFYELSTDFSNEVEIPTMGQWTLFILSLMLTSLGLVFISRNVKSRVI